MVQSRKYQDSIALKAKYVKLLIQKTNKGQSQQSQL